ncbi:hypothetical protein B1987_16125 [Mycobacterium kansasii]|uniref:hypothetical protein n=1 Tax=Mycobacterium attenuatum TaxID=2341086 RepID=UPI000A0D4D15|nr:hypothetical protein B1987_16125 [Mycobacterium kansasii]
MSSGGVVDRETVTAAFDVLDAALDTVVDLNFDALTTPVWLALMQRCEKVRRRLRVPEHQLINNLARQASAEELGGKRSRPTPHQHHASPTKVPSRRRRRRRGDGVAP